MLHCFIDYETRSEGDLRTWGMGKYARHQSTRALMLAYKVLDENENVIAKGQWRHDKEDPRIPKELLEFVKRDDVIFHAHNAAFERNIWNNATNWLEIPLRRLRCTALKAAHANQPRSLEKLGERLSITIAKDKSGKELIRKLSMPQKILKKTIENGKYDPDTAFEVEDKEGLFRWRENVDESIYSKEYEEFLTYNMGDVDAEIECDKLLPEVPERELIAWRLDRIINERGFPIDVELCRGAKAVYEEEIRRSNEYLQSITGCDAMTVTADVELKRWIASQGINWPKSPDKNGHLLDSELSAVQLRNRRKREAEDWRAFSLKEETVIQEMKSLDPESTIYKVLKTRLDARSNTVTKYITALNYVCHDGRVRESLRHYGAATGRWTGSGFHPHNFKRVGIPDEHYFKLITAGNVKAINEWLPVYDKDGKAIINEPIQLLKACVRGIIKAEDGNILIISDFAGIEARVLMWLCGHERMLELFRRDQDVYIEAATEIYGVKHEEIAIWDIKENKWKIKSEHSEKRQVGKQAQLGLGYGMGPPKFIAHAAAGGVTIDGEFAEGVVSSWRAANAPVVSMWRAIETAAKNTLKTKQSHRCGKLSMRWDPRGYLALRLPSSRELFYFDMQECQKNGFRNLKYRDGSKKGRDGFQDTYGGRLVENVVQAISRDLLVFAISLIERARLKVIFHVHDETVVEVEETKEQEALNVVHQAMQTVPSWAKGLPLAAETHSSKRYSK